MFLEKLKLENLFFVIVFLLCFEVENFLTGNIVVRTNVFHPSIEHQTFLLQCFKHDIFLLQCIEHQTFLLQCIEQQVVKNRTDSLSSGVLFLQRVHL